MSGRVLTGIDGTNPLGFLASLGLLRLLASTHPVALRFLDDGSYKAELHGIAESDIVSLLETDAAESLKQQSWWLSYKKHEKSGVKIVADLKAPPAVFKEYLRSCIGRWVDGDTDAAGYAAAFGTSVAKDGKGNTKPTAFHFTAANQRFLEGAEMIRAMLSAEWIRQSLFVGHAARPGTNLRWDPAAERNWALMAANPNDDGTTVDAPLEWLAFRALPLFPTAPQKNRVFTTGVTGRGEEMKLTWPLWSKPARLQAVRSLLWLDWTDVRLVARYRPHVFAVCTSPIRRSTQGFGNFAPAAIA